MDPKDRVEVLAKSKAANVRDRLGDGSSAQRHTPLDVQTARAMIESWPAAPKKVAADMIDRYGPPHEATPTRLIWFGNGPWKRTEITSDERPHDFPTPHTDYVTQFVDYRVPVDRFNDIARFDGSVVPNRTTGEVFAACDMEAMNILSLNLMHEIVTGRRTVEDARKQYAESASAYMLDRRDPYTERLLFEPPQGETADRDEAVIAGPMTHQAGEKVKDVLRGAARG